MNINLFRRNILADRKSTGSTSRLTGDHTEIHLTGSGHGGPLTGNTSAGCEEIVDALIRLAVEP